MNVGSIVFGPPALSWDSIARAYVERTPVEEVAVESFGPLAKYYDGCEPYIDPKGVWQASLPHEKILVGQNDNLRTVAGATERKSFVYLGSPYSLYPGGHEKAASIVAVAAAQLMAGGLAVYCPIAHGHFISQHHDMPQTWDFWKRQCQPMIDAAEWLLVLKMDGWEESVGLTYEIAEFKRNGRFVMYLTPAEIDRQAQLRRVA